MTTAEREAHRQRMAAMKAQREADLLATQQQSSQTAAALWQKAAPAPAAHEYLTRKRIKPHGAKFEGHWLLIPLRDTVGKLHSLQTIAPDGEKRFILSGRVKGCYHSSAHCARPLHWSPICFGSAASFRRSGAQPLTRFMLG